jgi:hypothetical protein
MASTVRRPGPDNIEAMSPMPPVRLLVGTDRGLIELGEDGPRTVSGGRDVTALSSGPGGSLWGVLDGIDVAEWADGRWRVAGSLRDLRARCLLAGPGEPLVGTSEAHLLRSSEGGLELVAGFETVRDRHTWFTPWGGPPDVRSLTSEADGSAIYANVHVGGIVRSRDAGETWEPTIDIQADVHEVRAHPERLGLVLAAAARGLAVSDDGGDTWRHETDGLHAPYCRAVAVVGAEGNTVLVSASDGPFSRRGAVYRASLSDGSLAFERCADGLPEWFGGNVDTGWLAGVGKDAALGTPEGAVFRSADAGATWSRVAETLGSIRCVLLAAG